MNLHLHGYSQQLWDVALAIHSLSATNPVARCPNQMIRSLKSLPLLPIRRIRFKHSLHYITSFIPQESTPSPEINAYELFRVYERMRIDHFHSQSRQRRTIRQKENIYFDVFFQATTTVSILRDPKSGRVSFERIMSCQNIH